MGFYTETDLINKVLSYLQEDPVATPIGSDHALIISAALPTWMAFLQQTAYMWTFLRVGVKLSSEVVPLQYPSRYSHSYNLPADFAMIFDTEPDKDFQIWVPVYNTNTLTPSIVYIKYMTDYTLLPPHFAELLCIVIANIYAGPWSKNANVLASLKGLLQMFDDAARDTEYKLGSPVEFRFGNIITYLPI